MNLVEIKIHDKNSLFQGYFIKLTFWIFLFYSAQTIASLSSSIPSTYADTEIPNSHLVSENIIRGMAPKSEKDIQNLLDVGVERFLMFKIDTNGDIAKEIQILDSLGITSSNRLHIEFPWKDISDYKPICEMTIEALNFLKNSEIKNKKVFFHCTLGEDRTGYLAGLYKIYSGNQETLNEIFQVELCDKGYEAGNPNKIYSVVKKVRENLTPAFLAMANLLEKNIGKKLTKTICSGLVVPKVNFKEFSCRKSKLLN